MFRKNRGFKRLNKRAIITQSHIHISFEETERHEKKWLRCVNEMNWTIMDTLVGTWRCHGEPVFGQAPLTRQSVYFPLFVIAFNVAGTSIHHRIRIQVHQLYAILVSSIRYYHSPVFKLPMHEASEWLSS